MCRRLRAAVGRDEGTITAEFALTLPAAVLVLVLALGALQAGNLRLRLVDAASIAARSLGRDESPAYADASVTKLVGAHSLQTTTEGDFICATVSAPVALGPTELGFDVVARSCAMGGGR
ncbi:hypothetical protein KPL76_06055 [Subtercola sp. PAMC28395]|uniref:TadE family type IV pilus minor pilin n=1 Tax=Subtercola sp. PAMC28395 TaxID=2846775 RepID=UPI001C0AACD9|nr:TadE family type IV pilus minor pilin [Subtercola sp. PAMC28395]QWT24919.1 hypothetical protein KPL76_06055 [Subtercola sp. PAMC28395]